MYRSINKMNADFEGLTTFRIYASTLQQPRDVRTKTYRERRFDRAGATLWNDLSIYLRKNSLFLFLKKGLKTDIFRQAYCDV